MRGDRNRESNDSPKIPDRGVTSDILGLLLGFTIAKLFPNKNHKGEIYNTGLVIWNSLPLSVRHSSLFF